jgi:hypothetical protein
MNVIMIIYQESIFINPMFLLLCVLCEMVGVTHNYYYYSILKRHERDKLKTLLLSLNYTTTIHTLCIEHMYMKLRFQQGHSDTLYMSDPPPWDEENSRRCGMDLIVKRTRRT